jgi:hypothetical protein
MSAFHTQQTSHKLRDEDDTEEVLMLVLARTEYFSFFYDFE